MTDFLSNYGGVVLVVLSCLLFLAIIKSVLILWDKLVEMIKSIGKKF